jgi:hypothetical protein
MDIKRALKGQYRAGLAMLRQTISKCSSEVWVSGTHPRTYWRIAYHALFYTHLYAMQTEHDFVAWDKHRECTDLWRNPPELESYTQAELLEYLDFIDSSIEAWVDQLDLEADDSGFSWYEKIEKIDHQLLNIRHLAGHMGQLSELAMNNGVEEIEWSTRIPRH